MQTVYPFGGGVASDDPRARDKTVTGGKGANLAEMAGIGLPVPPGFTITTEECVRYLKEGGDPSTALRTGFSDGLREAVAEALAHIERSVGKRFGDAADPLLVSVRSGARVSMPGMMDTVLNLGLNDETVEGLAKASGDERFAWDSYRRFIQMYSDVVLGLDHGLFEEALEIAKEDKGFYADTEMGSEDWRALVAEYKAIVAREHDAPFP
ncbi:MAG: PEP/pyruvate-binding domain-containing protein, partial [Tsuneonella sp.]